MMGGLATNGQSHQVDNRLVGKMLDGVKDEVRVNIGSLG